MAPRSATRPLRHRRDVDRLLAGGSAVVVALHGPRGARELLAAAEAFGRAAGVRVGAFDASEQPAIAAALGLDPGPAVLFFVDGREVMRELVPDGPGLATSLRRARGAWRGYLEPDAPCWPPRAASAGRPLGLEHRGDGR